MEKLSSDAHAISKDEVVEFTRQIICRGMGLVRLNIQNLEVYEFERTKEKGYEKRESGFHIYLTLSEIVSNRCGHNSPSRVQVVYDLIVFVKRDAGKETRSQIQESLLRQREAVKSDTLAWGNRD